MNINDDNLSDLDNDVLIQTPDLVEATNEPVVIVPQTDENKLQTLDSDNPLVQKLAKMDVTLKLIEDNNSKLISMKDVEADILNNDTIDRVTAEDVNTAFESFFTSSLRPSEFTTVPSKTNLAYTKRFISTRIAKEEQVICDNFKTYLSLAKDIIESVKDDYETDITNLAVSYNEQYQSVKEQLDSNKDLVVYNGDKFVNIYTCDLNTLDLDSSVVGSTAVIEALDAIKSMVSDIGFKNFVLSINNKVSVDSINDVNNKAKHSQECISICKLVQALTSTTLISFVERHVATLDNLKQLLKENSINKEKPDYSDVDELMSRDFTVINDYVDRLKYDYDMLESFKRLQLHLNVIVGWLSKL